MSFEIIETGAKLEDEDLLAIKAGAAEGLDLSCYDADCINRGCVDPDLNNHCVDFGCIGPS